MQDQYSGIGGTYILIDGVRVPANQVPPPPPPPPKPEPAVKPTPEPAKPSQE